MSGDHISPLLALCAALCLFSAPAAAECKDLKQFIRDETAGAEKYVDTFSFRRDHRADNVLMLVKSTMEKGHLPRRWLFLHRDDPNSTDFCVRGRGEEFGQHDDQHDAVSVEAFAPKGSGSARCATSSAAMRGWANRELGHGILLYAASPDTSGFQFAIGDERDWIIIEDRNDQSLSCFFDRGTDVLTRFNITVIQP